MVGRHLDVQFGQESSHGSVITNIEPLMECSKCDSAVHRPCVKKLEPETASQLAGRAALSRTGGAGNRNNHAGIIRKLLDASLFCLLFCDRGCERVTASERVKHQATVSMV